MRRAAAGTSPDEQVRHALEARRLLEPPLAALAAERATAETIAGVRRFLDLMEAGGGREPIVDYDSGFHVSIARAAGEPHARPHDQRDRRLAGLDAALSLRTSRGVEISMAGHQPSSARSSIAIPLPRGPRWSSTSTTSPG